MEEIRTFTEEHVGEVANLLLKSIRGQSRPAPKALQDYFREIFLCNPWISPEIPPLVYLENGKLTGFLGVIPRPMEFRGRPIRTATLSQFMADRDHRSGLAGPKLLRHVFNGPQELTFTDGAGNEASSVLASVGARVSRVYSFNWVRVLRPFQTARGLLDRMGGGRPLVRGLSGLVTSPLDFLLSKAPVQALQRPKSQYSSKPVSVGELLECIQESGGREALRPAYAQPDFEWLISEAAKAYGGRALRMMTVHAQNGVRCGWFVYYAIPGRPAWVLQIGCRRRDQFAGVLLALFEDAWQQGASAVRGQAIPQFLTTLTAQHCLFRQPYSCAVGYSRDPEIMNAFESGDGALSRLDATGWLRFATEAWI